MIRHTDLRHAKRRRPIPESNFTLSAYPESIFESAPATVTRHSGSRLPIVLSGAAQPSLHNNQNHRCSIHNGQHSGPILPASRTTAQALRRQQNGTPMPRLLPARNGQSPHSTRNTRLHRHLPQLNHHHPTTRRHRLLDPPTQTQATKQKPAPTANNKLRQRTSQLASCHGRSGKHPRPGINRLLPAGQSDLDRPTRHEWLV